MRRPEIAQDKDFAFVLPDGAYPYTEIIYAEPAGLASSGIAFPSFDASFLRMLSNERYEMIEQKEWWEKAELIHKRWFGFLLLCSTFGIYDLLRIIYTKTPLLLHWINDVFLLVVVLILMITLALELIEE